LSQEGAVRWARLIPKANPESVIDRYGKGDTPVAAAPPCYLHHRDTDCGEYDGTRDLVDLVLGVVTDQAPRRRKHGRPLPVKAVGIDENVHSAWDSGGPAPWARSRNVA
jgi:hypothetical protein